MGRKKTIPSDSEIVKTWRAHGGNNSAAARSLDLNESTVRRAVQRATGRDPRPYDRLPFQGEDLYNAFLKEGGGCNSAVRLARRLGAKPQSVRAALRRYLDKVDKV